MPLVSPRITTKSDYVVMEFDVPSARYDYFSVEISDGYIYIRGKYDADVRAQRFAMYPRSDYKFSGDFKIPVPITGDTRYIEAKYENDVLRVYMRRANENTDRTLKIYVR